MASMFRTLPGRLGALAGFTVILSAALAIMLESVHDERHLESDQRSLEMLVTRLAAEARSDDAGLDAALGKVQALAELSPGLAAYVLAADGAVLRASSGETQLQRKQVAVAPILEFIREPTARPLLGDDPAAEAGKAVFAAAVIAGPGQERFLYVVFGRAEDPHFRFAAGRSHWPREAAPLIVANVLGILLALLAAVTGVIVPLRRLGVIMAEFDASKFHSASRYRAARKGVAHREIDRLGDIFDAMADRISLQMDSLRRSAEARRELYAGISHDLETPLTALYGFVETLIVKEAALSPDERRRYLGIVRRQAEQLRELIGQIGDLARLEMPQLAMARQPVAVGALLRDIVEDLGPLLQDKQLRVQLRVEGDDAPVFGDGQLLRRAFANIVVNAIQAAPPSSTIGILVEGDAESISASVTDEGPGLGAEDLHRVFEPHYRGLRGAGPGSPGMGLGMAIAHRVFELHEATLSAENTAGGGAQFKAVLKRNGRPQAPVQGAADRKD